MTRKMEWGSIDIMDANMVDKNVVERLKRLIVIKENENLRTKKLTDPRMIEWIKSKIEEEVQCLLNR